LLSQKFSQYNIYVTLYIFNLYS